MSKLNWSYNPKKHDIYYPANKDKYIGKSNPITRSKWEYDFCKLIDHDERVLEWSSENLYIPYMLYGKQKRYYPDFMVKIKTANGKIERGIVEIKPYVQTKPPAKGKKKARKTLMNEKLTGEKNVAKGKAAQKFCDKMGCKFKIITEKQLYR